jgi:PIN domain nuclease of toxin-antitoxin system
MDVLLDTHVLLWAWTDDARLSMKARAWMASPDTRMRVSVVSFWEIAIKSSVGKLSLQAPLPELAASLPDFGITLLGLKVEHALKVASLPFHHRDPFDRMLIAQALHEGWRLATMDNQFKPYGVPLANL